MFWNPSKKKNFLPYCVYYCQMKRLFFSIEIWVERFWYPSFDRHQSTKSIRKMMRVAARTRIIMLHPSEYFSEKLIPVVFSCSYANLPMTLVIIFSNGKCYNHGAKNITLTQSWRRDCKILAICHELANVFQAISGRSFRPRFSAQKIKAFPVFADPCHNWFTIGTRRTN